MFEIDGAHTIPTLLSQGPWDPTTLHGGPVAGILAREVEKADVPPTMRVGRLTVDLFKPVPMAPLRVEHEIVRAGRKIHVVDARVLHEGSLVSRATAVFVRSDSAIENDPAMNEAAAGPPPPGPDTPITESFIPHGFEDFTPPGFVNALELRRVVGGMRMGSPAVGWARLLKPLVVDEEVTPLQRLATIGDFTSGLANYIDFMTYLSPNADLTFHLTRYPEGEWIGLDCRTVIESDGLALSAARLFDEQHFLGHGLATLVVSPR